MFVNPVQLCNDINFKSLTDSLGPRVQCPKVRPIPSQTMINKASFPTAETNFFYPRLFVYVLCLFLFVCTRVAIEISWTEKASYRLDFALSERPLCFYVEKVLVRA